MHAACAVGTSTIVAKAKAAAIFITGDLAICADNPGGSDGTRTRGLQRGRPGFCSMKSMGIPIFRKQNPPSGAAKVGAASRAWPICPKFGLSHGVTLSRGDWGGHLFEEIAR